MAGIVLLSRSTVGQCMNVFGKQVLYTTVAVGWVTSRFALSHQLVGLLVLYVSVRPSRESSCPVRELVYPHNDRVDLSASWRVGDLPWRRVVQLPYRVPGCCYGGMSGKHLIIYYLVWYLVNFFKNYFETDHYLGETDVRPTAQKADRRNADCSAITAIKFWFNLLVSQK